MDPFTIAITAGHDVSSSSVTASGSVMHVITDQEVAAFGITDGPLKAAVTKYFGCAPDDAFLHSDTPWGDLYKSYNWAQVQTSLLVQSATITGISSNPETNATRVFRNDSSVSGQFNASVSAQIQNTTSTNWSMSETISISESVNYKISFEGLGEAGGSVTWGYSSTFGSGGSESQSVTVGSSQGVTVPLQPGEAVDAMLTTTRGAMNIRVVYLASLSGVTAINYGGTYKGHHFWGLPITAVMQAAGIPTSITITEDIQVGYYTNATVVLKNPQGKQVNAVRALAGAQTNVGAALR